MAIDWGRREVRVQSRVVLRRGALEFLACGPGKEHESILRLEARPTHIYMALGLIGLSPGHPPTWNDQRGAYDRPAGDLLDITCEWQADGKVVRRNAFDWLREIEYDRTPFPRPWVFAGSLRRPDDTLAADHSGAAIALVDFPDSLVTLSRSRSSADAELWVEAATQRIPPRGTEVCLVLSPVTWWRCDVEVDFAGVVRVGGQFTELDDLVDVILLQRQLLPCRAVRITLHDTLATDALALDRQLRRRGCPDGSFHMVRADSPPRVETFHQP